MKKRVSVVLMLLSVIVFSVGITMSAYVRQSYVKAVLATNEAGKLFSSNLLQGIRHIPLKDGVEEDFKLWTKEVYYTVDKDFFNDPSINKITIPIKIFNHLKEDNTLVNNLDIDYKMTIIVLGNRDVSEYKYKVGNSGEYIQFNSSEIHIDNQHLDGRLARTNDYYIEIPKTEIGKVSFLIRADRILSSDGRYGTELECLASRVSPSLDATIQQSSFQNSEFTNNIYEPNVAAGYTFDLTLTGAPSEAIVKWDDRLQIDPTFRDKYPTAQISGNSVTVYMEQGTIPIQFYKKDILSQAPSASIDDNIITIGFD